MNGDLFRTNSGKKLVGTTFFILVFAYLTWNAWELMANYGDYLFACGGDTNCTESVKSAGNSAPIWLLIFFIATMVLFVIAASLYKKAKNEMDETSESDGKPVSTSRKPTASPKTSSNTKKTTSKSVASTLEEELKKASEMLEKGLIDEEEYKQLKKKIIEKQ